MKRLFITLTLILSFFLFAYAKEYQVEEINQKTEIIKGTLGIDRMNNERELKYLLVPTDLKQGQYKVKLHREDSNLYIDKQTGLYIKTKYCYENRYEIEAVLVVKSNYGSNRFELIIPDN